MLEFVEHAIYSLGGLIVGFIAGSEYAERKASGRWVRLRGTQILGVLLMIFSLIVGLAQVQNQRRIQALAACQTHYSNRLADALEARQAVRDEQQEALDNLVEAIIMARETPDGRAAVGQALENYREARFQQIKDFGKSPLPAPPRDVCRDVD